MTAQWTELVDATAQIRGALEGLDTSLPYTVAARWPRAAPAGNLITVTEITNQQTDVPVVDTLAYQIDIWGAEPDNVRALAPLVNAALCGIGLRRDYAGAAEMLSSGGGYFCRKTFRFGRKVDKRTMRLID